MVGKLERVLEGDFQSATCVAYWDSFTSNPQSALQSHLISELFTHAR